MAVTTLPATGAFLTEHRSCEFLGKQLFADATWTMETQTMWQLLSGNHSFENMLYSFMAKNPIKHAGTPILIETV